MLYEKQAADLLAECEKLAGARLEGVRGNLRHAQSRAAAVWELLVLEAAGQIGRIKYEPLEGASPDIELLAEGGETLWIEAAYLYPRFWREERRSDALIEWVYEMAEHRAIEAFKLRYQFTGDSSNAAGPIRTVPHLDDRKRFFRDPEIQAFFASIASAPDQRHVVTLGTYTVTIDYDPERKGPFTGGGGLLQEAASHFKQHAIFRRLEDKAAQHKLDETRVVCIGSDQSPAVRSGSPWLPTVADAVREAFARNHSLSAAIIVSIETALGYGHRPRNIARASLYRNPQAKHPLTSTQTRLLQRLDFNRWAYGPQLVPWETGRFDSQLPGNLSFSPGSRRMKIALPANVFVAALRGNQNVLDMYDANHVVKMLEANWDVVGCNFTPADPRAGIPATIELELQASDGVYWPTAP
jgi:hypothetical protein